MIEELVIAGHGGQGAEFASLSIHRAAETEKRKTTFYSSYGPTMRGGAIESKVVVSSEKCDFENDSLIETLDPDIEHPDSLIVMDLPSIKHASLVKPGGLIILNKSQVEWNNSRDDVQIIEIEADKIARNLGDERVANVILIGAYLRKRKAVTVETFIKVLEEKFGEKLAILELNKKALEAGWNEIKE